MLLVFFVMCRGVLLVEQRCHPAALKWRDPIKVSREQARRMQRHPLVAALYMIQLGGASLVRLHRSPHLHRRCVCRIHHSHHPADDDTRFHRTHLVAASPGRSASRDPFHGGPLSGRRRRRSRDLCAGRNRVAFAQHLRLPALAPDFRPDIHLSADRGRGSAGAPWLRRSAFPRRIFPRLKPRATHWLQPLRL